MKILFVMNNLNVGGAEKALVSLLNELDPKKYEIDLLLFQQRGMFMEELPEHVNILPEPPMYRFFDGPFLDAVRTFNPKLIYHRYFFVRKMQKGTTAAEAEQLAWKSLRPMMPILTKRYDVAIGYLEKTPNYFVIDKVNAGKKIGFIHNDYRSLGLNKAIDLPYFEKMDAICTISDHCLKVLQEEFPELTQKIHLVPNLVSKHILQKKALEPIDEDYWKSNGYKIVSVGRLEPQKGFNLSIDAAAYLKESGIDFRWFIFGEGSLRKELVKQIESLGLGNYVFLVGLHANPSKFMNAADVIVQTSLFEGKSIVIDEAKLLLKPIVVTDYPTAKDQIDHGFNGCIVPMDPKEIASQISNLINDQLMKNRFENQLRTESKNVDNKLEALL